MLKTEAKIIVASGLLNFELQSLCDEGLLIHYHGPIDQDFLSGAALLFIATPDQAKAIAHAKLARRIGVLVNTVDLPDYCDAYTPSIVDRDPVIVAIGTEGMAPVLAQSIKTRVEEFLEPNLGVLTRFTGNLRDQVATQIPPEKRRPFWNWVFRGQPREEFSRGNETAAIDLIETALSNGFQQANAPIGRISILEANRANPDLISLRGVKRLQEADIILFDDAVAPGFLELARRDANRINLGATELPRSWSQDRIERLMQREAHSGKKVVLLSLNPSKHDPHNIELDGDRPVEFIPCANTIVSHSSSDEQRSATPNRPKGS